VFPYLDIFGHSTVVCSNVVVDSIIVMVVGTTIYPCYEAEYNQEYLLKSRGTYQDSKGELTMHDEHLESCKQLLVEIPPFSEPVYACNLGSCNVDVVDTVLLMLNILGLEN
jgi:hypothetical protein